MNVNPAAKTILCYGDSNTWGQTPNKTGHRYHANIRWTGILQTALGSEYYVIEEGLSSRTTDLDYAKKSGRNGRTYLEPCLDSHAPLDVVVVMLGTNDFKIEFDRSVEDIAQATHELVTLIQTKTAKYSGVPAKIIVVSPILVDGQAPKLKEWYSEHYNENSIKKSQHLAKALKEVSQLLGCTFINAAQVARAGEDGIHFDKASHAALGNLLAKQVESLSL